MNRRKYKKQAKNRLFKYISDHSEFGIGIVNVGDSYLLFNTVEAKFETSPNPTESRIQLEVIPIKSLDKEMKPCVCYHRY